MSHEIEEQELTLATIGGGVVDDRFRGLRDEILDNIRDPNTSATAKRVVTVKVVFTPKSDRQFADIAIDLSVKLAPTLPAHAFAVITRKDGVVVATEARPRTRKGADPRQTELPTNVKAMPAGRPKET